MILITGATGTVGQHLTSELARREAPVRALVRDSRRVSELLDHGVQAVAGDYADPASLDAALRNVEQLFVLAPSDARATRWELALVDAAVRAGVERIVKLSVLGADLASSIRFARHHAEVEERIRATGIPATFLRPNAFMQNTLAYAGSVSAQGVFAAPVGDALVSFVDARDVADAAARVLTDPQHAGDSYALTGPEARSNRQIAELLEQVAGRRVEYVELPTESAREAFLAAGLSEWVVDGFVELFALYQSGHAAGVSPDGERLLGRPPRDVEDFLRDHAGAFRAASFTS